jgi:putative addiction module component (TIGR02574 family)
MVIPKLDIDGLTPDEKLALIERIWDSFSSADIGLSRAQRDELDRRLDDMERNPQDDITWTEALRRIRERKR